MKNDIRKGKVTVIGSFNADLVAYTSVFPEDGESVHGHSVEISAGGKGSNQATAAHRAGGDVTLVTKVGSDFLANLALDHYKSEGMSTQYVFTDNTASTGAAVIEVNSESAENRIIVAAGANMTLCEDEIYSVKDVIASSHVLLLQYEVTKECIILAKKLAVERGVKVVVNPAPYCDMPFEFLYGLDCITPNETEARYLTGIEVESIEDADRACEKLHGMGIENVVITLGKRGAYYSGVNGKLLVDSIPAKAVDTTGAGDSFNGAMCVSIAEDIANGKEPDYVRAVRMGNCTGSLAVLKKGASKAMPYREETQSLYDTTYDKQ